jgi:toxin ParE1/3/4
MKVSWTEPAARQLDQAFAYISEGNLQSAESVAQHIVDVTEMLAKHPQAGRRGRIAGTREFAVPDTPFLIVYSISRDTLWILAVYHGARKWPDHF